MFTKLRWRIMSVPGLEYSETISKTSQQPATAAASPLRSFFSESRLTSYAPSNFNAFKFYFF